MQHVERRSPQHARRKQRAQRARARGGEGESRCSAQSRKQQTLDGGLAEQSKARGAQRDPDREFMRARRGARQHQIRDVHGRDQENQRRRGEQRVQPLLVFAGQVSAKRRDRDRMPGSKRFVNPFGDARKIAPRGLD